VSPSKSSGNSPPPRAAALSFKNRLASKIPVVCEPSVFAAYAPTRRRSGVNQLPDAEKKKELSVMPP
jgi:hypothetical protein